MPETGQGPALGAECVQSALGPLIVPASARLAVHYARAPNADDRFPLL